MKPPSSKMTDPPEQGVRTRGQKRVKTSNEAQSGNEIIQFNGLSTNMAATTLTGQVIQLPPEMLTAIVLNLDSSTLLKCRGVNLTWRLITSRLLLQHPSPSIKFTRNHGNCIFNKNEYAMGQLKFLISCLKGSLRMNSLSQFPCTHFEFRAVSLDTQNMQEFFRVYGGHVKTLKLFYCKNAFYDGSSHNSLARLLLKQAPNIENLIIYYHFFEHRDGTLTDPTDEDKILYPNDLDPIPSLPNLKSLDTREGAVDTKLANELIDFAPNLKHYKTPWFGPHVPMDRLNLTGQINQVTFDFNTFTITPENIHLHERFSQLNPKLEVIQLRFDKIYNQCTDRDLLLRVGRVLENYLRTSKDSLIAIKGLQPLRLFEQSVQFPVLRNLKELKILNNFDVDWFRQGIAVGSIFPEGGSCTLNSVTFPNLKKLTLDLADLFERDQHSGRRVNVVMSVEDYWSIFFNMNSDSLHDHQLASVTTLNIRFFPPQSYPRLTEWLPNLNNLVVNVDHLNYFELISQSIWALGGLNNLEFFFHYDCGSESYIDEFFTRSTPPPAQVRSRRNTRDNPLPQVQVEQDNGRRSMTELTNLKSLVITSEGRNILSDQFIYGALVHMQGLKNVNIVGATMTDQAINNLMRDRSSHVTMSFLPAQPYFGNFLF